MIIRCKIYFVFFLFSLFAQTTKIFYNENFQIYGIYPKSGSAAVLLYNINEIKTLGMMQETKGQSSQPLLAVHGYSVFSGHFLLQYSLQTRLV